MTIPIGSPADYTHSVGGRDRKLRIAIVGAGPGGLAATILLRRLPFAHVEVFDQARELREVGAGISINQNTWRLLKVLGAAEEIEQYTKRSDGRRVDSEHRNGITGEVLLQKFQQADPEHPARSRIERYKLQRALLSQIPAETVQLGKKLARVEEHADGVDLVFASKGGDSGGQAEGERRDGWDLVIGADGIRSATRAHVAPEHRLSYTGKTAYRTLIPAERVAHIKGLPRHAAWWHSRDTHVYTDFLDNGLFEIATRAIDPQAGAGGAAKVSWGREVPKDGVMGHYRNYGETVRQVIEAPDTWLEFALFGGPRLESVISESGRVVLLGDASHPLSGAFGSGAAFAFEDAFVLASALADAHEAATRHETDLDVRAAAKVYDEVRAPRYRDLYAVLDQMASNVRAVKDIEADLSEEEYIREATRRNWSLESAWIYTYDITKVWAARSRSSSTVRDDDSHLSRQLDANALSIAKLKLEGESAAPAEVIVAA